MEDRETPQLRKYGESKMTQIMMATVPHLTAWAGRMKYHADGFLFDRVYLLTLQFLYVGGGWSVSCVDLAQNYANKKCF
jgi:hypothetical protein